jgi:hypothetical protein
LVGVKGLFVFPLTITNAAAAFLLSRFMAKEGMMIEIPQTIMMMIETANPKSRILYILNIRR